MNVMRSQIFMLRATDVTDGKCSVCSNRAKLKFRDHSTGYCVGQCCLHALLEAEKVLASTEDLRHPNKHDGKAVLEH